MPDVEINLAFFLDITSREGGVVDEVAGLCQMVIVGRQEILKTNNEIYEATGKYPEYMRPPYGAWKKNMELCVEMLPVFWDIDTLDWKSQNVDAILKAAGEEPEDGSIILMHDEYQTSVEAALLLIDRLKEKGYEFVTVDELIVP